MKVPLAQSKFQVSLWTSGRYELLVNNKTWLASSPNTFLKANGQTYSTTDGSLSLNGTFGKSGYDVLGRWQSMMLSYAPLDDNETRMEASIITYDDYDCVRFQQVDSKKICLKY